jgi:hypothetical protein
MSVRGVWVWLFFLVLGGAHAEATASCDISGSSVLLEGIEKRDRISVRVQTQDSAAKPATPGKADSRETQLRTVPTLQQTGDIVKPAASQRN